MIPSAGGAGRVFRPADAAIEPARRETHRMIARTLPAMFRIERYSQRARTVGYPENRSG